MDQRNVILAAVVSIVILFGSQLMFAWLYPTPPAPPPSQSTTTTGNQPATTSTAPSATAPATTGGEAPSAPEIGRAHV